LRGCTRLTREVVGHALHRRSWRGHYGCRCCARIVASARGWNKFPATCCSGGSSACRCKERLGAIRRSARAVTRSPRTYFTHFKGANSAIACSVALLQAAKPARPGFAACLPSIRSAHGRKHRSATIVGFPALPAPRQQAGRQQANVLSYCLP